MHAYILVGQENSNLKNQTLNLAAKLGTKIMEFPLAKIEDVRYLNDLIRLKFGEPTLIVCPDIHKAGEEALNAFLKNLEEPQENIYFALTAPSTKKVLPTIVSRCQVIQITNKRISESENVEIGKFWKMTTGEKLSYIDKIKDRNVAIDFVEELAFFMHGSLHQNTLKYNVTVKEIEIVLKTLSGLKANGNVNLQLSNLVIQLDKQH
jgi:DNA polymerase III delta prime subunit